MSIPYIKEKINCSETLKPEFVFLKNNNAKSLKELPAAPENCILCPWSKAKDLLEERVELVESVKVKNPVYTSENFALLTGYIGFGAPIWIWALEQLIFWGVKNFIFLGWFGKVNPEIKDGGIYVCTKALRDEGTSYHYAKPTKWAYPDKELSRKILAIERINPVTIWTTDAMFRQTQKEIDYAIKNHIAGFEMELSALFVSAKFKKVNMASIQIVSDYFINGKYRSMYQSERENSFNDVFKKALFIALKIFDKNA